MTSAERAPRSDSGSGAVLALAVLGALVALAIAAIPFAGVLAQQQATNGASDAAALAAADARSGAVAGEPCALAEIVARANGSRLTACALDGPVATVRVNGSFGVFELSASSTAGPPNSESQSETSSPRAGAD